MPCTACPEGGTALPNPPNGYLMEWAQHCSKLSGAWEQGTTTKIFCGPPVAGAWVRDSYRYHSMHVLLLMCFYISITCLRQKKSHFQGMSRLPFS